MSSQHTVLTVDDDEKILSALAAFLKQEHCRMISATNVNDALRQLERHTIDLLISDIRLRHESGVNLLLQVKGMRPGLPVIIITGYEDLVTPEDVKAYGASFFFLKPFDLEDMRRAIRTCLRSNHQPTSQTDPEDL